MSDSRLEKKILIECAKSWGKTFGGISALDISDKFKISNRKAMGIFERFVSKGLGTINANVTLGYIKFRVPPSEDSFKTGTKVTHIFFPSQSVLKDYYYESSLSREDFPEYTKRLFLGAHQLKLVLFKDEVLQKYFSHQDKYEINDTLAGGDITSIGEDMDENYIYVRYGKKLIDGGYTAISVIMKDLHTMSVAEQNYWSAYELKSAILDQNDKNFQLFLKRTYDGEIVHFPDIFSKLKESLNKVNRNFSNRPLFNRLENSHLRSPVENTNKSFMDICSELYKLIGPDNINDKVLHEFVLNKLKLTLDDIKHKESGRNFSTMQLIDFIQNRLTVKTNLTDIIKKIQEYRTEADHKILTETKSDENYVKKFNLLCLDLISELELFAKSIEEELY